MEQKTLIEKLKRNPFFWIFSGKLFFLSLNIIFSIGILLVVFSFLSSVFVNELKDPTNKALVINPLGPIVEQIAGSDDPLEELRGNLSLIHI